MNSSIAKRFTASWLFDLMLPIGAVLLALLIGAVLLLLLGENPVEAYWVMFSGAFGSVNGLASTVVTATPLLLVGLGVCISFRGGVINIGGEGQLIVGALGATATALALRTWPGWLLLPLSLLAGALAGGVWGGIAGVLKARLNVNEILSTVMLNAIALQLMNFLLSGPMLDPAQIAAGTNIPQSDTLPEQVWLMRLIPRTLLHTGAILAVVLAFVVYLLLWRTTLGYRIRAVGLNPSAARYAGMNVPFYLALSLIFGGAFAGLAGAVEVMGVHHRIMEGISGGYGFGGIVAALFGKLHPLGTIPASFLFGGLLVGADKMQRVVQVPSSLVVVIDGLVVMFVVASDIFVRRRARRRVATGPESAEPMRVPTLTSAPGDSVAPGRPMIQALFSLSVLVGVVYSAIRLATPYLYAALGETIGQRSGVLNLGVDGIMLMGAFMAYYAVYLTGDPWLGVLAALITGALMGLLMAVISVTLQAEQGISGIGLYLFGFGLSSLLLKVLVGTPVAVTGFEPIPIPVLSRIPVIGPVLFDHNILIYLAYLLVPATTFLINRTNFGLKIRAVGQNPQAADSLGVSVHGVRYATVITGSALAGVAGASLSIGLLDIFQENITNGLGFIAVALVYFGNWRPRGVLFGALLFSAISALQMWIQLTKLPVPSEVAIMLPYALTIIVLALGARQARQPQALAKPFERGE